MTQNQSPLDALPVKFLGTLTATTNDIERVVVPGGPSGTRVIATVSEATLEGPNIKASLPKGVAAGDWLTIGADGSMSLDVRASLRTEDGADIYTYYTGVGKRVGDEMQIRSTPRFETSDERYSWLNTVQAVGIGRIVEQGVVYDIYELL